MDTEPQTKNNLSPYLRDLIGKQTLDAVATEVPPAEAVEQFEKRGWAFEAPTIAEQATDTTRSNPFTYGAYEQVGLKTEVAQSPLFHPKTLTEQEGILELQKFIHDIANNAEFSQESRTIAEDLNANLAIIGGKEIDKAARVIATSWEQFLDQDDDNQICVITEISGPDQIKSDRYVFENVLEAIPDERFNALNRRILMQTEDITAPPQNTRIILLDDWTISEAQLRTEYQQLEAHIPPEYKQCVEVQLVAATESQISEGIQNPHESYPPFDDQPLEYTLPIKACYKTATPSTSRIMVTGTHSASDMSFETIIARIVSNEARNGHQVFMPPMTNIVRNYRQMKLSRIDSLKEQYRDHSIM